MPLSLPGHKLDGPYCLSARSEACHFIMGSVCKLLEGPELEALAPEIAEKLGLGLRCGGGPHPTEGLAAG